MSKATVQKVATELESATEPVTIANLASRVGFSPTTTRRAVAELVDAGRAVKDNEGKVRFVREGQPTEAAAKKVQGTKQAPPKNDAKLRAVMDGRDEAILDMLKTVADVSAPEVADKLGITTGAAGTALWRLRGKPVGGVAKSEVLIERTTSGRYELVGSKAKARKTAKKS